MSLNLANLCRKSNKNRPIKWRSMQSTLGSLMDHIEIESPFKGLSKCKHGTNYVAVKYTINNDRSSCLIFEKTIKARACYINDDSPMISSLQERSIIGYGYTQTLISKTREKCYSIER